MTNHAPAIDTNALFEVVRDVVGTAPSVADVVVHARGERTTVFVGSELALELAHTAEEERLLVAERRCFEKMSGRVSFLLPRSLGTRVLDGHMVDVRTRVVGSAESAQSTPARSQAFGMWMGRALAEMHDAFSSTDLRELALPPGEAARSPEAMRAIVEERFTGAARESALRFVERWSKRPRGGECFSHGPFDAFSLAFDTSGVPRGLNDLRNAGLRRPACDLAYLCDRGEHVLRAAEEGYAARASSRVRVAHAEIRATHAAMALSALCLAAERMRGPEDEAAVARAVLHATRAVAESTIA